MEQIIINRIVSKAFGGKLVQNTLVVVQNGNAIIFDAGTELKDILPYTKNLKVLGIFITHSHFDHITFLEDYVNKFDCKVYISKKGVNNLSNPKENLSAFFVQNIIVKLNEKSVFPLLNNQIVEIENFKVKCFSTPGHSKCSMCFLVDDNLFCGDSAFAHGVPRTDFHTANENKMKQSLKKISKINFKTAYGGHGRSFSKQEHISNMSYWI